MHQQWFVEARTGDNTVTVDIYLIFCLVGNNCSIVADQPYSPKSNQLHPKLVAVTNYRSFCQSGNADTDLFWER